MRVHHINCGTMCPLAGGLLTGEGSALKRGLLVAHCLLIETDQHGLVLLDTGFGLRDTQNPAERLGKDSMMILGAPREVDCAIRHVERLGFKGTDVRHIILTHMDVDHAGGISDFPHARIHVMNAEHRAAVARESRIERMRYRPIQWEHGADFVLHEPTRGESWRGFSCVRNIEGLPPEILMLPLEGHTRGHACVAIDFAEGPLVYAGDAYFHHDSIHGAKADVPAMLRFYEWMLACDKQKLASNHIRLRALAAQKDITLFCAHDVSEFREMGGVIFP